MLAFPSGPGGLILIRLPGKSSIPSLNQRTEGSGWPSTCTSNPAVPPIGAVVGRIFVTKSGVAVAGFRLKERINWLLA